MRELSLRPLSRKQVRRIYRWEMCTAFPQAERRPLWGILRLMASGNYDAFGLYQGDELMGYAMLWRGTDFVLLDYLAACGGKQGRGVGTKLLEYLREHYAQNRALLVEVEAVETDVSEAENYVRARRLSFYCRNGFIEMGYEADIFCVRYTVLGCPLGGMPDKNAAICAHDEWYRTHLPRRLYRRYIHIPNPSNASERRKKI